MCCRMVEYSLESRPVILGHYSVVKMLGLVAFFVPLALCGA